MADDWKKRREYRTKIAANEKALALLRNENDPDYERRKKLQQTLAKQRENFEIFESGCVIKKARKRAIDIPSRRERPHWWKDDQDELGSLPEYAVTHWLSETGRIGVLKLIQQERRADIEWWAKLLGGLIGSVTALLGVIVALVSVSC